MYNVYYRTLKLFEQRIETIEKQTNEIHQHHLNLLNQKLNSKKEVILNTNPVNEGNNANTKKFHNSVKQQNNFKANIATSSNEYSESNRKFYVEKNENYD